VAHEEKRGSTQEVAASALEMLRRPVTILVGHFGSGKTEIAINLAFGLRRRGAEVTLVDLDLVKPYFRCRIAKEALEAAGIRLVAPKGEQFYADLPILVPDARAAARDSGASGARVIFDVGGHDLGARALGSLSGLLDRQATDLLFVVNASRPFAEDLSGLQSMLTAVQAAGRLAVTGLVANTHLMDETTRETIQHGIREARGLEAATGIPVRCCAMLHRYVREFGGASGTLEGLPILALERHVVPPFGLLPGRRSARV